jgi:hypothetical protein
MNSEEQPMPDNPQDMLATSVKDVLDLQSGLAELAQQEQVKKFLETQSATQKQIDETWGVILAQMQKYNIKSLKGEWGSITLVQGRISWDVDLDKLPDEFKKVVADTKKLTTEYDLTEQSPEGASPKWGAPYLNRRLK